MTKFNGIFEWWLQYANRIANVSFNQVKVKALKFEAESTETNFFLQNIGIQYLDKGGVPIKTILVSI